MNETRYYALLDGHEGAYGVVFPDLGGCCAMGHTREEAINNAVEAMNEWLNDAVTREGVPKPRSYDALMLDEYVQEALEFGSVFVLIDSPFLPLSPSIYEEIETKANLHGLTRTAFIEQALRHELMRTAA